MKRVFSIFFLFFILTNISCHKENLDLNTVDGIVKDATTGAPLEGATVYWLEHETGGIGSSGPSLIIDSSITSDYGLFEFEWNEQDGYDYSVTAYREQYFELLPSEIGVEKVGEGVDVEIELQPEAFLKVRVHNLNTYDAWDHIDFSNAYLSLYGNSVDTSVILTVYGNQPYHLVWFIYDDGTNNGSETADIYCPAFDTTYYELLY